ncbi:hypothetical protein As57867_024545, partial [Aphanomyces stellatus]
MATRLPPRGEIRTDFRQHPTPEAVTETPVIVNFETLTSNSNTQRSSLHSSHSGGRSHRNSSVEHDVRGGRVGGLAVPPEQILHESSDVAILGAATQSQPQVKPHELNDEYYAYLYTIEGAWYKKLYFGIWGILIAIALGIAFAYAIDQVTDAHVDVSVRDGTDTKAIFDSLQRARDNLITKRAWNEWVRLPGDLLIRGLQCLIVPMIFVNVTIGVADIFLLKKAKMVGWRMFFLCLLTTILSVALGITLASILPESMFQVRSKLAMTSGGSAIPVSLTCPNKGVNGSSLFMATQLDPLTNISKMMCLPMNGSSPQTLVMTDVHQVFKPVIDWAKASPTAEQVFFNLTDTLITDNIVGSFTKDGSLVSLVVFAMPLGIALASMGHLNPVLDLFRQLNSIFLIMIGWVINFVPIAVIFLVASAFIVPEDPTFTAAIPSFQYDPNDNSNATRRQYGQILGLLDVRASSFFENARDDIKPPMTLLVIFLIGTALHILVIMPCLTYICTRRNPFAYMMHLGRALNFGFGSGSSLAALPMAVKGIDNSQTVSHQLTRFLLPIGTGIHLDGAAFYLAACAIFLARAQQIDITAGMYLILFFTAVINSWSCPPIPHGGLVALKAVWSAMVPGNVQPAYFVWIVALDVLLDRFSTVMNIMSNAVVIRIIAEQIDETYVDEQDRLNLHAYDDDDED